MGMMIQQDEAVEALGKERLAILGAAEAKCTTCAKVEGECRCPEPTFLVFDYPAAARSLMTSLAEFCDDSLPPSEQIAEAGRRARREIESLRARLSFPAVPHAASPAAGPGAPSGEKPSERIACGASHPDPEVEARPHPGGNRDMIQQFVDRFMAAKDQLRATFGAAHPDSYAAIVKAVAEVVGGSEDYGVPDPERIHTIDDGDYQGTLVFVIAAKGCQPWDYWYVKVGYGSCSGCDTLKAIRGYRDDTPSAEQVDEYLTLALHVVQGMKKMGST